MTAIDQPRRLNLRAVARQGRAGAGRPWAMSYPLLWLAASSLKPESQIFSGGGLMPETFTLHNYIDGWSRLGVTFGAFMLNSFLICVLSIRRQPVLVHARRLRLRPAEIPVLQGGLRRDAGDDHAAVPRPPCCRSTSSSRSSAW